MAEGVETFLYFSYASNLLSDRILFSCPTAVKKTTALLKNHELIFSGYSGSWKGAKATIIEKADHDVWGVVWELPTKEKERLDREEPGYSSILVKVETLNKEHLTCSTYKKKSEHALLEEEPSGVYKQVILKGAKENNLPEEYVQKLEKIRDNGYNGPVEIHLRL